MARSWRWLCYQSRSPRCSEAGFPLLHNISDQSSFSPSSSSAGAALGAPEQQALTSQMGKLAGAAGTVHPTAFGQSEGDGALQIPLDPFSSSPAALGKALCPWQDCDAPWRVKQQLPAPGSTAGELCLHITLCPHWGVLVAPVSHESPGFPQEMSRDSAENDAFQ